MTIGELKELLSKYPDYYPVMIRLVDGKGGLIDAVEITDVKPHQSHVLIEPSYALEVFDPHGFE